MHHFVLNLIDFNDIQSEKFSLKVQPIEVLFEFLFIDIATIRGYSEIISEITVQ